MANALSKVFTNKDKLTADALNAALRPVYAELEAVKEKRADYESQITRFNSEGIKRVAEAIKPLVDQLSSAIDGGLLVVQTDDLVAIVEGEEVSFLIPETARVAFRPTPFLAILAPDVREDWAIGRVLVYNDDTGLLTVEILHLNGSGAERTGWTISASSGVVEAVSQWLDEITAMRDAVALDMAAVGADKATVAADKAMVLGYKNAAAQSVVDAAAQVVLAANEVTEATYQAGVATAQAGIATTKAAEAAASAASLAAGPVYKVNGRTGEVTGLAEASDIYSKTASDTRYPLLSNTGTAAAKAADTDGTLAANADDRVPTQKAVRTLVDPLVPAIGDIRYSLRSSVAGWLRLDGSIYLKSAYPSLIAAANIQDYNYRSPVLLANSGYSLSGTSNDIAWSPNGRYVVVTTSAASPYIHFWDWNTGSPVKMAAPATAPAGVTSSVVWSPDSRYVAVTHATSPFITIYDMNTGVPVKIANPASTPPAASGRLAWSPNGRYLAVSNSTTPYITIYDWQSGAPVKIANPASLPNTGATAVAWSADSRYLAIGATNGTLLDIYDLNTGLAVKTAWPASPISHSVNFIAWSPNGRYMICANTGGGLTIFEWIGGSPDKIANFLELSANIRDLKWSLDGRYLAVVLGTTPSNGLVIFDFLRGIPPERIDSAIDDNDFGSVAWSGANRYIGMAKSGTPYLDFFDGYAWIPYDTSIEFMLPEIENAWVRAA